MCLTVTTTSFQAFLKRHSDLAIRTPERVSAARASVTEVDIRLWFQELYKNVDEMNLKEMMTDPTRVFNCDESCIQLSPSTGRVVSLKGTKNVYEVAPGPEKSNLTFVGTFSAAGDIVKPTIIYPYIRIPKDIMDSVPETITAARTESGWMTSQAFMNT